MRPTLYIHLGQQKTGTSSFQRFCTKYRKDILDAFGILYPEPPAYPPHRHASLFPFVRERWERVRKTADASGCRAVILSNEDLSVNGIRDRDLESIRAVFKDFSIVYILYLRRVDEACKEWYMQSIKRDRMVHTPYAVYLDSLNRKKSFRLYPSRLLQKCEQQVGKDNLRIRIYQREKLLRTNIIDDIFSIFDVTLPDSLERSRLYNRSIPEPARLCLTDTLRAYDIDDPVRKDIYDKIIRAFSEQKPDTLIRDYSPAVQKEIDSVDAYVPGYKDLFAQTPLDLSLSGATASPYDLLILDLLYSILFELQKRKTRRLALSRLYDASRDAIKEKCRSLLESVRNLGKR